MIENSLGELNGTIEAEIERLERTIGNVEDQRTVLERKVNDCLDQFLVELKPLQKNVKDLNVSMNDVKSDINVLHLEVKEVKSDVTELKYTQQMNYVETIERHPKTILSEQEIAKLEKWSKLKCREVIFDTNINNWEKDNSDFGKTIIGKGYLMFLIEDHQGELFGFSIKDQIKGIEKGKKQELSSFVFEFNLNRKKRLMKPKRYRIKKNSKPNLVIFDDNKDELIEFDSITLMKQNCEESYCKSSEEFDYERIDVPLCETDETLFKMKRLIVIQMQ